MGLKQKKITKYIPIDFEGHFGIFIMFNVVIEILTEYLFFSFSQSVTSGNLGEISIKFN